MVDINLFDEEDDKAGKKEKDWDSTLGKAEGPKSDSFKDELSLDDDLGSSSLGDEGLLGEEEVVPELEEAESPDNEDKHKSGGSKKKKTPASYYLILAVAVIAAAVYTYMTVKSKGGKIPKTTSSIKTSIAYQSPSTMPSATRPGMGRTGTDSAKIGFAGSGVSSGLIDLAKTVFGDLSKQEQFGAVLMDGDRFAVEYVSSNPAVSKEMGKRIQGLMGSTNYIYSPELRHQIDGKTTYMGVISGVIEKKGTSGTKPSVAQFTNSNQFEDQVKGFAKQNNLSGVDVRKLYGTQATGQIEYRLRVEGSHTQAMGWLEQMKKIQPPSKIKTLLIVPMDYSDRKANNIKVVLDLSVSVG